MMRAKLQAHFVYENKDAEGTKFSETISMHAVARKDGYPADGADEDNTYAKWSPQAEFKITIANPTLWGKINTGDKFYVDFTKADA